MANLNATVLIIEDNKELADIYEIKLRNNGARVLTAADGEEGLLKYIKEKPDFIILDLLMPHMNGFEFLQAIEHYRTENTKIIVLTNIGQADSVKNLDEYGIEKFLIKTYTTPGDLINELLSINESHDSKRSYSKKSNEKLTVKNKLNRFKKLVSARLLTDMELGKIKALYSNT